MKAARQTKADHPAPWAVAGAMGGAAFRQTYRQVPAIRLGLNLCIQATTRRMGVRRPRRKRKELSDGREFATADTNRHQTVSMPSESPR